LLILALEKFNVSVLGNELDMLIVEVDLGHPLFLLGE